ncbi:MAG TPA: Ig-like domain-containing protein, partial [Luteolibacter sp.]|nr:Ig-like domain-containing protein [Luteolibacter sp.]
ATLNITVNNVNDAPVFASDPFSAGDATEDAAYADSIAGSASDDDGDALTYAKVSGPVWLSVAADGTLSGTPTNADVGTNAFTVSVTDSIATPVTATLNITVNAAASSIKLLRTTVTAVSNNSWKAVSLGQTYNSPVIVATPIYANSNQPPVVTRLRNVTPTGFELKLDRADGQTGAVSFDVSVVVVDEGVYTVAEHGVKMEAVKFTSTLTAYGNANWVAEARTLQNNYATPVVVGQVMSANDARWSAFWSMGSSRTEPADALNFNVGKHVGQDPDTSRADETIGYIVIEAGSGLIEGVRYEAGVGADIVQCFGDSATPYSYPLTSGLPSASAAALSQTGMDGNDGAWAVLSGSSPITPTALRLHLAEDAFKDSRRKHATEQVNYIVFQ